MKGIHQGMRQVADESHGIGNHDIARAFNPQLARSRIERGKQLVCRIDARASQGIEQRGFTRVGITNQELLWLQSKNALMIKLVNTI